MNYEIELEGRTAQVQVKRAPGGDGWLLQVDEGPVEHIRGGQIDAAEWLFDIGGRRRSIGCHVDGDVGYIQVSGHSLRGSVVDPRDKALGLGGGALEGEVSTPMPGVIVRIPAPAGTAVKAGDVLIVVEAMKMENEYKSPIDGVVREVHVEPGQAVEANSVLVSVDPEQA